MTLEISDFEADLVRLERDLRELEEELRDAGAYTRIEGYLPEDLAEAYDRVREAKARVEDAVEFLGILGDASDEYARLESAGVTVVDMLRGLEEALDDRVRKHGYWADGNPKAGHIGIELQEKMREFKEITGRRCGFVLPDAEDPENVDLALAINDVSNCVHVLAEEVGKRVGREVTPKCYVTGQASEWLVDLCRKWSEKTDEYSGRGLYAGEDEACLVGIVEGNRAGFRVGSTAGHATRVEDEGDRVDVRYYDTDRGVNELIAEDLKRACKCEVLWDGVSCSCPKNEKTKRALATAMALATSKDIRIGMTGLEGERELEDEELEKELRELEEEVAVLG